MHPNQENIFGTPIWGFMLQDQDLQTLDYTDYLINLSETEQPKRKSNMGGFQTRDNLQEDGIFQEFNQSLLRMCKSIIDEYNNNASQSSKTLSPVKELSSDEDEHNEDEDDEDEDEDIEVDSHGNNSNNISFKMKKITD